MWRRLKENKTISRSQLAVAIAALVTLGYLAFLFLPRRAAIASLVFEREELEAQTATRRATLVRLNDGGEGSEDSDPGANEILRTMPASTAVAELLTESTRLTREI